MKHLSLLCLLTSYFIYSADESSFLIRFRDKPGTYRIKIEMVKNVEYYDNGKSPEKYDTLFYHTEDYTQRNELESLVIPYLSIPQDAEFLRISIRSGKKFSRGWRHYFSVSELREKMSLVKTDKVACPGIKIKNQFETVLESTRLTYTIESDSVMIQ